MINLQGIINEKIKEAKSESREIKHWHPSKLGSCMRGMYLERLGVKPDTEFDARTLRVFNVGHLFEDWIVELIEGTSGYEFTKQVRVEDKALDIAGYADLFVKKGKEQKLYEIKSKHSRAFWYMENKKEGANHHHKMQLWLYLKLLNVSEGAILYVSKDDLTLAEYPVLLSDIKLGKEVMKELEILNACWKNKTLPPLAEEGSWQAKFCRFHRQCKALEEKGGVVPPKA